MNHIAQIAYPQSGGAENTATQVLLVRTQTGTKQRQRTKYKKTNKGGTDNHVFASRTTLHSCAF